MFYVNCLLHAVPRDQFDGSSNRHPKEAKENADEPLELGERRGVSKIS